MNTIYLNIKQAEESRVIVTRNSKLIDFGQEFQGEENKKGNIYKGIVTNIEPSLEAVFVDFGENKNGLLPLREIPPNAIGLSEGGVKVGDQLLVQIKKDNIGDKGAGLTGYISLAGRFLVLLPYRQEAFGVSSSASPNERKEMNEVISALPIPENMGVIARSLAVQHSAEDILWDLECYLLRLWDEIKSADKRISEPVLIYRENDLLLRVIRDYFRPDNGDVVICDQHERYQELHAFVKMLFPDNIEQIRYHGSAENMVPQQIEQKIEQMYTRDVSAASGVRVVFDTTEALVAIDVNSGRQRDGGNIEETALKTNMEAAEIITEQLRLRNLGGLIVIDFIDMRKRENCEALERRVAELVRKDRARTRIGKISEFGLMEISRQRTSRALLFSQTQECGRCGGSGQVWREQTFALHLLRKIRLVAFSERAQSIVLQVPREAGFFLLNEKRFDLQQIENDSGCSIVIVPDNRFSSPHYKLKPVKGNKSSALDIANQMVQQEEADDYAYKKQPVNREKQPVLRNMLPQERMPSRKAGFWEQLFKTVFGGGAGGKPQQPRKKSASRQPRQGEARRGAGRRTGSGQQGRSQSQGNGKALRQKPQQQRQAKKTIEKTKPAKIGKEVTPAVVADAAKSDKPRQQKPVEAKPPVAKGTSDKQPNAAAGINKAASAGDLPPSARRQQDMADKPSAPVAENKPLMPVAENKPAPPPAASQPVPTNKPAVAKVNQQPATQTVVLPPVVREEPAGAPPASAGAKTTPPAPPPQKPLSTDWITLVDKKTPAPVMAPGGKSTSVAAKDKDTERANQR